MSNMEDLLLVVKAQDDASKVLDSVEKSAKGMGDSISSSLSNAAIGFESLSNAASNLISKLSNGKTISEMLIGTPAKAETNAVLVQLMSESEEAATKLNQHIDDVTNSSLVSMQNLIPAMNAFKTATGATDEQIYNATDGIANFGAKVLAQTGSVELSEQAMMDLSKGIKGACASLDQYGITEDALKRTGLWNGKEDDIEGYMAAVQELTGDTTSLMETSEGLDARLGKAFSSAGKKIGNEFLPMLKDAKKWLLDLNDSTGGNLFAGLIVASGTLETVSSFSRQIADVANGLSSLKDGFKIASDIITKYGVKLGILTPIEIAEAGAEEAANGVKTTTIALNWVLLGQILLVVAVIAALVAAVYLVGKHFGLWNDPMEMCTVILGALGEALKAVADFLVGAFTNAWNMAKGPLMAVWNILQNLWNAFAGFASGQITIQQLIITVWNNTYGLFFNILNKMVLKVIQFGVKLLQEAVKAANQFLLNFISRLLSLPSRIWSIFLGVIRMVQNAVSEAGSAARNVAQAIWNGLTGKLSEFGSWVIDTILGPLKDVYNEVTSWGGDGNGGGAAGSADLPRTALEAGTFIGGGYFGKPIPNKNTTNNRKVTVNNVENISFKLDNVTDTQAKRILVQALDGLEQTK